MPRVYKRDPTNRKTRHMCVPMAEYMVIALKEMADGLGMTRTELARVFIMDGLDRRKDVGGGK